MKFLFEVTVIKGDGGIQNREEVRQALAEEIQGIGSVFVQDERHDDETEYEVTEVIYKEPNANRRSRHP